MRVDRKALLIVIDGGSYELLERLREGLPNLSSMISGGVLAKLNSVYPSLTPVAMASLFTGVSPKRHGVVASKVFVKGNRLSSAVSAFSSNSLSFEPIWATLARNGYRVIVASAPQALPDRWKLNGLLLLDPYKSKLKGCSEGILLKEGGNRVLGFEWIVKRQGSILTLEFQGKVETLREGEWSQPLFFDAECNGKKMSATSRAKAVREGIYIMPPTFYETTWSNSEDVKRRVWEEVVKKWGMALDGDYRSLNRGLISFEDYMETVKLSFEFFLHYSRFLLTQFQWDFASAYLPVVDNLQHLLYGARDPEAFRYIAQGYNYADSFVGELRDLTEIVLVASDHGVEGVKKRIYMNNFLSSINVLKKDNNEINWKETKAVFSAGGLIRVNLKGREEGGIVDRREFPRLIRYITRKLEEFKDPENGLGVFTSIVSNEVPAEDREGDIVVRVNRGYSLSTSVEVDKVMEEVKDYRTITADHGYYNAKDMEGILILYGKGIAPSRRPLVRNITDVAATILRLYHLNSSNVDGTPILVEEKA